jgi:SNF2 family DNA or RNA helicase
MDNHNNIKDFNENFVLKRTKNISSKKIYNYIELQPSKKEEIEIEKLRKETYELYNDWLQAKLIRDNEERIRLQGCILALISKLRIKSNYVYYNEDNGVTNEMIYKNCSKINRIINDIDNLIFEDSRQGIVVFSFFSVFLDVLEKCIYEYLPGIKTYKFTGSVNVSERNKIIEDFNSLTIPRVLLITIGSGGTGISLHKGSSTILICEPNFNPFIEIQAEERVHRLGQLNNVKIYKYNLKNSVETWILKLQDRKKYNANNFGMLNSKTIPNNVSMSEIKELFDSYVKYKKEEIIYIS